MAPKGHKADCNCPVCKSNRKKQVEETTGESVAVDLERLERCEILIEALCKQQGLNSDKLYTQAKKRLRAFEAKREEPSKRLRAFEANRDKPS